MSKRLLVDVGNSRLKWALADGRRLSRQQAIAHGHDSGVALRGALGLATRRAQSVSIVSVAAPTFTRLLLARWRKMGLSVTVERSRREQLGLRNGYSEPWRLGADRWVAMLGARSLGQASRSGRRRRTAALLVVSAGTAMTVDLVDRTGRHRGGVIVPGLALMQVSLLANTAGIARRARRHVATPGRGRQPVGRGRLARNTAAALAVGAREACAGLVERLRVETRRELGHYPQVVLTGGDAPALATHLRCPYQYVPDLVLRGLAAAHA